MTPEIVKALRGYTRAQFTADLAAGLIVGVVALPLAIAFGIASGVPPEAGLFTAVIGGFLISALGGSRVQIGGPTGAFIVIVYGVVQQYGLDGLALATLMAGLMLIILGVARLGSVIKFIPYPVTTGFTTGIAVIIFSGQIRDFLGLDIARMPAGFVAQWSTLAAHLHTVNWWAAGVAGATLMILAFWPRVSTRLPAPFVGLIVATALVQLLDLPVQTIGDRFGEVRASLPHVRLPEVTFDRLRMLSGAAFTIAMLAGIESLLSAVVADGMLGTRHNANVELVAQGVANIASPLFGGIPVTGAIARTATNIKNGGRSPVAGMVHALTLLLITLFLGHWAARIPMAALAAILVMVSYHMSEWRRFRGELRAPRSDVAVLLVTFTLTVLVDLTAAVEVGMVLAAFLFMKRMSEVTNVSLLSGEGEQPAAAPGDDPEAAALRNIPSGVDVYEIDGPFFFGAADSFRDAVVTVARRPKVLIVRMRRVPVIDSTGMAALRDLATRSQREGTLVILSDVHSQPVIALKNSTVWDELGAANITGNIDDALNRARTYLGLPTEERPAFARPTVARETEHGERRRQPRPPRL